MLTPMREPTRLAILPMMPPRKKALNNEGTFFSEMGREVPQLMLDTTPMEHSVAFA